MATQQSTWCESAPSEQAASGRAPCVWLLLDSRPGHRNQVLGLTEALQRRLTLYTVEVSVHGVADGLRTGLRRQTRLPNPRPDAIIAAGHSTHLPLWMLGRRCRAKTILLMKSTLPCGLYDACVIPDVYDFHRTPANVILTAGVLNRIRPSDSQDPQRGLILVGGPSSHHGWSDQQVLQQVRQVVDRSSDCQWTIATSRRTPEPFESQLNELKRPHVRIVAAKDVNSDWLPDQLAVTGTVWVTGESVSMLYEAVTSGARVGLLELPRIRRNKATRCIDLLLDRQAVTSFTDWDRHGALRPQTIPLKEADRCADELLRRQILPATGIAVTERSAA